MKRKVFCTSTGCLDYAPERYLKQHDIGIIRIRVLFNGKEYKEGYDLNPVEFYNQLETLHDVKNNLPKTAMPTREEIQNAFEQAIADGNEDIFVITLSSGLGGTYNFIRLIAEEYKDKANIYVFDAKITCFGEGLLAVKAAEMIEQGVSTQQIIKEINWMISHQKFLGVDGKLDYLIYNGRLKGGKAFFGKMLSICPVLHFNEEGECSALCTVRTQGKALEKTCELLKEMIGDRQSQDYVLFHVYTGPSLIEKLIQKEKAFGIQCNHEAVIMSPVSGCHNGPWLAGYGYFPLRRADEPLE